MARPGQPMTGLAYGSLVLSSDGRRYAYSAHTGGEVACRGESTASAATMMKLPGRTSAQADYGSTPAHSGKKWVVVIDGQPGRS